MAKTIIIGGGVIGLGLAYHLAKRRVEDVLLLERNQLTSGTSWHAAGIVGPLRATPNMTKLAKYAGELFPKLEAETGMSTGYKMTGGYWLARKAERMDELNRIASLGRHYGLTPEILTGNEVRKQIPYLDLANHCGAMSVAEDANVNPVDLCMAYARAARNSGVEIREGVCVAEIIVKGCRVKGVKLENGEIIEADRVALCAGAWSKPLAERAGVSLPLQAVEHMYVVTEAVAGLPDPFPVIRDLDTGIYIKGDTGGKLVIGGFEPNAKCWDAFGLHGNTPFLEMPEDWEQFTPFMEAALDLMPALEQVGVQHFMNGPESFTNDTRPLVGEAPEVDGLFVAAGMNSVGVMSSAGIGNVLADWVVDGVAPVDLWEIDVARVDPQTATDSHIKARMAEAVADQFAMHWPYKQPTAGRGLRKSVLHEKWKSQGAVFGITGGWERGLWYAQKKPELNLPYSVGEQSWQSIVEREATEMQCGAVLLDLSPFGKFDIVGEGALSFVNYIACAQMDVDVGKAVYTPLLNEKGGIEADVTITRTGTDRFRLISGAATRWRDAAHMRRLSSEFDVSIADVTEEEAVIGLMGKGARKLISPLCSAELGDFPFGTARQIQIHGYMAYATRISFVGEPGWELTIPVQNAAKVFDLLIEQGAKPMGHYALEACRIEKGYRAWGHDLGPDITPLEAGLGFTIDWNKDFFGKKALIEQKKARLNRRIQLFSVHGKPLVLHDEPIIENGRVVGLTTSGAVGARTGLTLALGLIEISAGETLAQTCERKFKIEIAGKLHEAEALLNVPFDPAGERMRS